ncbi:MAG: MFS transporter [Anaerolineae bacterium]|nr:MFS transporter [Anaerolineae bacterium]
MSQQKNGPLSLLLIAYFSFVVIGVPGAILNIAWTYMHTDPAFQVSFGSLGILMTFSTLGYLATSFVSGRVIGRFGIGATLVAGSLLGALGMASYIFAPAWFALLVLSMVASAGSGLIDTGLNNFVSTHYSVGRLNWLHAAFGIGASIGPILATFVVVRYGGSWRMAYAVAMALFLLASILFIATRKRWTLDGETKTPSATGEKPRTTHVGFMETLRMPLVALLVALFFIYGGVEVSAPQLANTLFMEGRGVDQETAGFWISAFWFAFTFGRILTGFVADRFSTVFLVRFGTVGAVIGSVLLALNVDRNLSFLGLAFIGFAIAPMFATLVADTPRRVGLRHAPNAIGFQVGMCGLGIGILPGLGAFLAERLGPEAIGPFVVVFSLVMFALFEVILMRENRLKSLKMDAAPAQEPA